MNEIKQDFKELKESIKGYFAIGFTTATAVISIVEFALAVLK